MKWSWSGQRAMRYIAMVALTCSVASLTSAQEVIGPATFSPPSPSDRDRIVATYTGSGACTFTSTTLVNGNVVRTTVSVVGCIIGPPPAFTDETAAFGPLPAGKYTYELYESYEGGPAVLRSSQELIVTTAVPTLSPVLLGLLAASFCVVALAVLHRSG